MTLPILVTSSLLVVILCVVLAREVRLRRALQRLLAKLLAHWRNAHENNSAAGDTGRDATADPADRVQSATR